MDKTLAPKYAVIYQSKTGNTKKLAEQIYNTLDTNEKKLIDIDVNSIIPEADIYLIGFGVHNNFCSMDILDIFEQIRSGKIALFATCGYLPTEQYKEKLEKSLDVWLLDDVEYLGMFLCQGNIESDRRDIMIAQMFNKEKELKYMFKMGSTHPDQEDIEAVTDFAIKIQSKAEYDEKIINNCWKQERNGD